MVAVYVPGSIMVWLVKPQALLRISTAISGVAHSGLGLHEVLVEYRLCASPKVRRGFKQFLSSHQRCRARL